MNKIRQYTPAAEPHRELVECAIVGVLEMAQRQGITVADCIQMLDSGVRISDFLTAMNGSTTTDHTIDSNSS
jgi:hypothetical protein